LVRQVERRSEVGKASKAGGICDARLDAKIHPPAPLEGAKFGLAGFTIDPAVDAGAGETRRRICGNAGRDSGRPEYRSTGRAGRHNSQGNLEVGRKAAQTERRSGATRRFTAGEPEDVRIG